MTPQLSQVHHLLDRAAALRPSAPAVTDDGGTWDYRRLAAETSRLHYWLTENGVRAGDRLVAAWPACSAEVALMYACSRGGAAFVPVPATITPFQFRTVLSDVTPAVVVTQRQELLRESAAGVAVTVTPRKLLAGAEAVAAGGHHGPEPGGDGGQNAFLLYTSGSSAAPKAVVCPHEPVLFAVAAVSAGLRYRRDDVIYCRVPMSFDYGLYQALLSADAQCELVLDERTPGLGLMSAISARSATVVPLVPSIAAHLAWLAARNPAATRVRLFTSTGAPLSRSTAAGLRRYFPGARVCVMYGLTECKRAAIMPPDGDIERPGSVGRALPGTRVYILADGVLRSEPWVTGEIVIEGPHVMDGYWRAPELTVRKFSADPATTRRRLRTGDLGFVDEDEYLYVLGRLDETFKRHGVRMSCQEIEAAALDVPGVFQAALVPPREGEDMTLYVAGSLAPGEVLRQLAERLDDARCPARCQTVKALPLTPHGKVDRRALPQ